MDEERTVVRRTARAAPGYAQDDVVEETVRRSPSGAEVARRIVVFVFGVLQLLLVLRIVLMLLGADRANALVRDIYDVSAILMAPFDGILRADAIRSSGSILDVTAIVALVGWTILELAIVAAIGIARREP